VNSSLQRLLLQPHTSHSRSHPSARIMRPDLSQITLVELEVDGGVASTHPTQCRVGRDMYPDLGVVDHGIADVLPPDKPCIPRQRPAYRT
jgi:hypothetical protein